LPLEATTVNEGEPTLFLTVKLPDETTVDLKRLASSTKNLIPESRDGNCASGFEAMTSDPVTPITEFVCTLPDICPITNAIEYYS